MSDAIAALAADRSWPKANDLLTREELSRALTERGLPITVSTLAAMVTRGGGPPLQRWGRRPLYRWKLAWAWAAARLCVGVTSSPEVASDHRPRAAKSRPGK
jgi:hypothetical protein